MIKNKNQIPIIERFNDNNAKNILRRYLIRWRENAFIKDIDNQAGLEKLYQSALERGQVVSMDDLVENYISKMNLKGLLNLEELIAPENMINEVSINLYKLRKLNLSSNLINKFPSLNGCPNLKELYLGKIVF